MECNGTTRTDFKGKGIMPYIKKAHREPFNIGHEGATDGIYFGATNPGELNYMLTKVCLSYLEHAPLSYQQYNDVVGALEACKLEFYRRAVAPYEDKKIQENGDVF